MSQIEIAGFEIIERIGAGGMATVWKARQLSLDRIVAVKILYSKFSYDSENLRQFKSEAQAAAKLKHPGIVQVYDASVANDLYYFVMEYVAGYTVGEWVRRRGALAERDALLVVECVASALQYAWSTAGIIHCDIKPDNILVDADGTVKVSDLGLARTLTAMAMEAPDDDVMGTPPYMSPEQIRGDVALDFRTDIYSLGAMLYHLLTGRMPFEGYGAEEVMQMQLDAMIPDPMDVNAEVSRAACWLVERMMAKQPENRQESWEKVLEDIDRVKNHLRPLGPPLAEGASTVARSPERSKANFQQVNQWRRKSHTPLRVTLLVVLIVALVGGAFVWIIQERSRRQVVPDGHEPVPPPKIAAPDVAGGGPPPAKSLEESAQALFEQAESFLRDQPLALEAAMGRYQAVLDLGEHSYAARTRERMATLQETMRENQIRQALMALESSSIALANEQNFDAAVALCEGYTGDFAQETIDQRRQMASVFRRRAAEAAGSEATPPEADAGGPRGDAALAQIAEALVKQDARMAQQMFLTALWQKRLDEGADMKRLSAVLEGAANGNDRIIRSFAALIGKEDTVHLNSGATLLTVDAVGSQRVMGRRSDRSGERIEFGIADLSYRERLTRLGDERDPAVALAKGLMALDAHAFSFARRFFAATDPLLREHLLRELDKLEGQPRP